MSVLIVLVALGLLYWWTRDHLAAAGARRRERQERCPHAPEHQRTIRVNAILTANPRMIDAVIPGRRWLVKRCDACGRDTALYGGFLQPWDEYLAEYTRETRDREAEFAARHARHQADLAERKRQKERRSSR